MELLFLQILVVLFLALSCSVFIFLCIKHPYQIKTSTLEFFLDRGFRHLT